MNARRRAARAVIAGAAALVLGGLGAAPAFAAGPTAHIDEVEATAGKAEITLSVSDLPPDLSLGSAEVRVTANGTELPAEVVPQSRSEMSGKGELPRSVMVVDTSGSMETDLAAARDAALNYIRSLPPDARIGLIAFADRPRLVVPPTANQVALVKALDGLKAAGATSLYDAVKLGASTLDGLGGSAPRRLVVLSDGADTASSTSLDAVAKLLATEKVTVDIVAFRYGTGDTSGLRRLANAEGGRVLMAEDSTQLTAAFGEAARRYTERALISVEVPHEFAGESVLLSVTVSSEDNTFGANGRVSIPGGLAWYFTWLPAWSLQVWLLAGLTFVSILLSVLLAVGFGRREEAGSRVLDLIAKYGPQRASVPERPRESGFAQAAVGWTEQMLRARGWEEKVAERLDLASVSLKPAEWTLLRACASFILSGLFILLGVNFFVAVALGVLIGWVGTMLFVTIRVRRRRAAFADQLPDVLQLVAGSLRSGFSLAQALDAVVREDTQPAAGEISRALAETRIGVELEDALDRIAYRMASDDLKWIVMAIRIQREVGGNLAEVLLNTVTTMRERAQMRRQVRALSAEGRLSAYVLLALPFGMAAYFYISRPEYLVPLYTTFPGIVLLVIAVVFMALGSFWMSRLVKVEV